MQHECTSCGHSSIHHHSRASLANFISRHSQVLAVMPRVATASRPKVSPQQAEPDLFESSLSLEEQHIQEGYEEGLSDGRQEGAQEGRELGCQKGFQLAQELGFYRGCLMVWEQQSAEDADLIPVRAQKAFPALRHLLDGLKDIRPKDESLQQELESARSKFRATVAILGMQDDILLQNTTSNSLAF